MKTTFTKLDEFLAKKMEGKAIATQKRTEESSSTISTLSEFASSTIHTSKFQQIVHILQAYEHEHELLKTKLEEEQKVKLIHCFSVQIVLFKLNKFISISECFGFKAQIATVWKTVAIS